MPVYQFPGPQTRNIMQDIIRQKAKGRITYNHMVLQLYDTMESYGILELVLGTCRLRRMKDCEDGITFKQVFIAGIGDNHKACPACGKSNYSFISGEHYRMTALCNGCGCVYLKEVETGEKISSGR